MLYYGQEIRKQLKERIEMTNYKVKYFLNEDPETDIIWNYYIEETNEEVTGDIEETSIDVWEEVVAYESECQAYEYAYNNLSNFY